MKKWMILFITGIILYGTVVAKAAPAFGYNSFLQSMDGILSGATMPIADEKQIAARMPTKSSGSSGSRKSVIEIANSMLGQPVVWGGASLAQGFDCSGLVQYVYRQAGISLPRTADLQFFVGQTVSTSSLQPGDLVYFTTYEPGASHVGIYIGNDKFIHTSFSQGVVAIGDMNDNYFVRRYYGAKRVV